MSIIGVPLVLLLLAGQFPDQADKIAVQIDMSPAALKVYQEELLIALSHTPGATVATRASFKREAETLIRKLAIKGQDHYHLKHRKVKIAWDLIEPFQVAISVGTPRELVVHLDEIMFFSYHEQHLRVVIPHEVAHLIHYQFWGYGNPNHDESFRWIVSVLAPGYIEEDLDPTPGCRLLERMQQANGVVGSISECGWFPTSLER